VSSQCPNVHKAEASLMVFCTWCQRRMRLANGAARPLLGYHFPEEENNIGFSDQNNGTVLTCSRNVATNGKDKC
jgi:hypothetical protein